MRTSGHACTSALQPRVCMCVDRCRDDVERLSLSGRDPSPISSAPPPPAAPSRPEPEPSRLQPQPAAAPAAAPAPAGLAQLSAEEMKKKGAGMLREFMNLRSTKDAVEIITSELVPGQADFALIIEEWFAIAFLERGIDLGALKVRAT